MSAEDFRAKSEEELVKVILELRKQQFNARFQKAQGSLENTAQVRKTRRDIATAKTILNEKRNGGAVKASSKKNAA